MSVGSSPTSPMPIAEAAPIALSALLDKLESLFQHDSPVISTVTRAIYPDLSTGTALDLLVQMFNLFEMNQSEDYVVELLRDPPGCLLLLLNILEIRNI